MVRRGAAIFGNILMLAGLVAMWVAFAPAGLGGWDSYAIVNGVSMEPNYHTGDLIVARRSASYQVGEVVVYRDALMDANIVHRIIATAQDRFILKGDNNSWKDDYQPTQAEILGKQWIYLPGSGAAIQWLQYPLHTAIIAGTLAVLFILTLTMPNPTKAHPTKKPSGFPGGSLEAAVYSLVILGVACLALTIFVFSRPLEQAAADLPYQQSGAFFYSTAATPGVYDTDSAQSGDPLFTKLTCSLNLGFTYTLAGQQLADVHGSQRLSAEILDEQSGWKHTIPLGAAADFSGASYTSQAALDLCQVQALVNNIEQQTGLHVSAYTLTVMAEDTVNGTLAGQAFTTIFTPALTFRFDSLHFYINASSAQANPLQTVQSGKVGNPALVESTFQVLGLHPTVRATRVIGVTGFALSLGGLLALGYFFYTASRRDPDAAIRFKYSSLLMDVYDTGLKALSPVVNVATIDDLARLAERQNVAVMHLVDDYAHYYFVQIEGMTYRWVTGRTRKG